MFPVKFKKIFIRPKKQIFCLTPADYAAGKHAFCMREALKRKKTAFLHFFCNFFLNIDFFDLFILKNVLFYVMQQYYRKKQQKRKVL